MTQPHAGRLEVVVRRLPLYAFAAFVLMTTLTTVLAGFAHHALVPGSGFAFLDGPRWLDAWFQGDSGWYYGIVENGYSYTPGQQSSIAFFPAYPLEVRAAAEILGGDISTAAGLVTLVCGAGVVVLFAEWVRSRVAPRTAVIAVALILLYPYSFFLYGSGYGDASFMLAALGSFALLERRHYLLAGLVGAVATSGRPVGIAVAVGLVVRAVEFIAQDRAARRGAGVLVGAAAGSVGGGPGDDAPPASRPVPFGDLLGAIRFVRWRQATLLVSVAGLVAWMVYLGRRFGDPLAFATVQGAPGWNQGSGPHTWFKLPFFGSILFGIWDDVVLLVPQALACLAAVLLLRTVWRRFGWGYTAYTVVSLAIPIIGTKDFMGSGRYVLAAYPVLAAAAVVLTEGRRPRWLVPLVLTVLAVGLAVATVAFVNDVEVS